MNELIIFTMLLVAVCVGLLIALCICIRKIIKLQERRDSQVACIMASRLMDISVKIDHLENQIPNRYKNQNGDCGILYHKEDDK